ncbi:helix-turn-helix domain-containing protein [Marinoscillum luteum]|uniref:Helix-turn-helix domain-containing protein n=1 Tax=Marinoscillum luteum TaxID=861051 RepID=A0ABM8HKK4_9BACT
MKSLGITLKETRESISLTLRQVEEATGISNAYLSQLENDKIKRPSANILYKLADVYKIDLNVLLSAAGIIKKSSLVKSSVNNEWSNRIAFYAENLGKNEKKDVLKYIEFLVNKKK